MNVIQVKSNEVLEGILHGLMHKGINTERHQHSAPDVLYISTSDRAADFEVRGILRKNTVPDNFLAAGYSSVLQRVRGRSLESLTILLSPECLHVDPGMLSGAMAQLFEHRAGSSEWSMHSTLVVHGPHSQSLVVGIQQRLYKNYLDRNPMFRAGSPELESNITFDEFRQIVQTSTDAVDPETKMSRVPYFFGTEFLSWGMEKLYNDLLTIHPRVPVGNGLVLHPHLLYRMYNDVLSVLRLPVSYL